MHTRELMDNGGERRYAVIFETGDEVVSQLGEWAREENLSGARLTAIGAFSDVVLGYFDWHTKRYRRIPLDEQVEVLSFIGDVALEDGAPALHAHVVVGRLDGSTRGGHLLEAHVRPTLELIVDEAPVALRKRIDAESGLALIAPQA